MKNKYKIVFRTTILGISDDIIYANGKIDMRIKVNKLFEEKFNHYNRKNSNTKDRKLKFDTYEKVKEDGTIVILYNEPITGFIGECIVRVVE